MVTAKKEFIFVALAILFIFSFYFTNGFQNMGAAFIPLSIGNAKIEINQEGYNQYVTATVAVDNSKEGDTLTFSPSISDINAKIANQGYTVNNTYTLTADLLKEQCIFQTDSAIKSITKYELRNYDVEYGLFKQYGAINGYQDVINICKDYQQKNQYALSKTMSGEQTGSAVGAYAGQTTYSPNFYNFLGGTAKCYVLYNIKTAEGKSLAGTQADYIFTTQFSMIYKGTQQQKNLSKGMSGVNFDFGNGKFAEIRNYDAGLSTGSACAFSGNTPAVISKGLTFASGAQMATNWESYIQSGITAQEQLLTYANNPLNKQPITTEMQSKVDTANSFVDKIVVNSNYKEVELIGNSQVGILPTQSIIKPVFAIWSNAAFIGLNKISGEPKVNSVALSKTSDYAGGNAIMTASISNLANTNGRFKITYSCPSTDISGTYEDSFAAQQTKTITKQGLVNTVLDSCQKCTVTATDTTFSSKTSTAYSGEYCTKKPISCTTYSVYNPNTNKCECTTTQYDKSKYELVETTYGCILQTIPPKNCGTLKPNERLIDSTTCFKQCEVGYLYDLFGNCAVEEGLIENCKMPDGTVVPNQACFPVDKYDGYKCVNGQSVKDDTCKQPTLLSNEALMVIAGLAVGGILAYVLTKKKGKK